MPDALARLRSGALAMLFLLAAGISLLLMPQADSIGFSPQRNLYIITGIILTVASIGPLHDLLDMPGQVLTWNGLGWCTALAVFGLENVGSLPLWPIVLAGLALTFWPRWQGSTISAGAIAIAFVGGFGVCWLAWSDIQLPQSWVEWI